MTQIITNNSGGGKGEKYIAGQDIAISGGLQTDTGSGSISVSGAISLDGVIAYGGAVQNGTPTPTNPVDIECNNGVLKVNNGVVYADGTQETISDGTNTANAEMLLAISSDRDEQNLINGKITRKVKALVLDGTEGWTLTSSPLGNIFKADILDDNMFSWLICTHFKNGSPLEDNIVYKSAGLPTLQIRYDTATSVEEFIQFLENQNTNGTPVIVLYSLNTPTKESVAGQTLALTDGEGTFTITDAQITPLNIGVSYRIPGNIIDFTNETGYITNAVDDLINYYTKQEVYTKDEINSLIDGFGGFLVVSELPTTDIKTNIIYLLGPTGTGADKYEEYIYSGGAWVKIGDTSMDLTNYFNKVNDTSDDITQGTTNLFATSAEKNTWNNKQDAISDLDTIRSNASAGKSASDTIATYGNIVTHNTSEFATSTQGAKADTALQPNDNVSELVNDAGYLVSSDLKQPNWEQSDSSAIDYIKNKPTIGNATLTIQKNGTTVNSITMNSTSNVTANISVPTDTSDLTNGAGFITNSALSGYQTTANLVTDLSNPDNTHYPSAKAVSDALSSAGAGDMLKSVYDPNNVSANVYDYDNFINTPTIPGVIDALNSTSTTDALSANQGKVLKDAIDNLSGLGKFLSLWNSATGQPISFPLSTPYTYTTGDWFMVEVVGTTNYKPTGSSYTGTASTSVESGDVKQGDVYIYDGTDWLLQVNNEPQVSFSEIAGQPTDNSNLATALNAKANDSDVVKLTGTQTIAGTKTFSTSPVVPSKSTDATNTGTAIATEAQVYKVAQTVPTDTGDLTNNAGFITSADLPTVNNATLTIQKNGTTVNTFTANASSNVTANITVPTDTGDLTNGAGFITGITSGDVTTALGYTPYNSTNPSGYVTSSIISDTAFGSSWDGDTTHAPTKNAVYDKISAMDTTIAGKQDTLVSGTNIKTINSNSILGSGNLDIDGLPSQTGQSGKYLTTDGTTASWGTVSGGITNDTTGTTTTVSKIRAGTEAEYTDLSTKDENTIYYTF